MSKAILQTLNTNTTSVAANGLIPLGSTTHRYGGEITQNGDSIVITGIGYYKITANVVLTPDAVGNVSIGLFNNGVAIPGAVAIGSISTAENSTTLPITFIIRRGCCCGSADVITCVLMEGASDVINTVVNVEKL